jgi:hypothetical protein
LNSDGEPDHPQRLPRIARACRKRIPAYAALALIVLLAFALRIHAIARHGLWQDEWTALTNAVGLVGTSYTNVFLPPAEQDVALLAKAELLPGDFWAFDNLHELTAAGIREDSGNGWLHKILLHYWIPLGGVGERWLRLPSCISGVVVVALTYIVARLLPVSISCSLLAAALVAIHPLLIRSSQEVRGYTMATVFTLLCSFLLLRSFGAGSGGGWWCWVAYTVCAAVAFLCHYLALSIVAAHVAYVGGVRPPKLLLRRASLAAVSIAGLLLLWYSVIGREALAVASLLSQDFSRRAALRSAGNYALPATPYYLLAGLSQIALALFGNQLQETGLRLRDLTLTLFVPLLLTGVAVRVLRRQGRPDAARFLIWCSFVYPAFALGGSILQGNNILFATRYVQFFAPYAAILLAVTLDSLVRSSRRTRIPLMLLFGLQLTFMLWSIPSAYEARLGVEGPARAKNRYSGAAKRLIEESESGSVVWVQSLVDAKLLNLYLKEAPHIRQRIDASLPSHQVVVERRGEKRLLFIGESY